MRLCSSAVCLCESDCKCVCFHPLDGKDGLLLFISPWLQDYRGTARKAVWQQVADAKMSTKICIQARTIPVCMWASPLIVNPFSGNRKCMTRLLTHLFCSLPFPPAFPLSLPFVYFPAPSRSHSWSVCLKTLDVCVFQVYYQECETFGLVAKMLIAKDQSLERSIQSSLQENLRDIGKRCVEAMEKFIEDYDSREMSHWSDTYSPSCLTRIDPTGKKKEVL